MPNTPKEIKRLQSSGLEIEWNDGAVHQLSSRTLRINCPCATCREQRGDPSHQKPLGGKPSSLRVVESSVEEETSLEEIWAVGNYALGLRWRDGHTTGIYTFEYLRQLGREEST